MSLRSSYHLLASSSSSCSSSLQASRRYDSPHAYSTAPFSSYLPDRWMYVIRDCSHSSFLASAGCRYPWPTSTENGPMSISSNSRHSEVSLCSRLCSAQMAQTWAKPQWETLHPWKYYDLRCRLLFPHWNGLPTLQGTSLPHPRQQLWTANIWQVGTTLQIPLAIPMSQLYIKSTVSMQPVRKQCTAVSPLSPYLPSRTARYTNSARILDITVAGWFLGLVF